MIQKFYEVFLEEYKTLGPVTLGPLSSFDWRHDPRHVLFTLSRYKFCAKLLAGKKRVLEMGCGDGIGAPILLQEVERVHGIDLEPQLIEDNMKRNPYPGRLTFECLDITEESPFRRGMSDAALATDVIEHIPVDRERNFMENTCLALVPNSILILGTPNITSQEYASQQSKEGHVNLKNHKGLKGLLSSYFHNVLLFSMSDEVIHTGYYPMAQYLFGVGIGKKT